MSELKELAELIYRNPDLSMAEFGEEGVIKDAISSMRSIIVDREELRIKMEHYELEINRLKRVIKHLESRVMSKHLESKQNGI